MNYDIQMHNHHAWSHREKRKTGLIRDEKIWWKLIASYESSDENDDENALSSSDWRCKLILQAVCVKRIMKLELQGHDIRAKQMR